MYCKLEGFQKVQYKESFLDDLHSGMTDYSWYVTLPLHACRSLFDDVQNRYRVDAYVCACGETSIAVLPREAKKVRHVCQNCHNTSFIESSRILTGEWTLDLHDVPVVTKLSLEDNTCIGSIWVNLPIGIDLARDKVCYAQREVYRVVLSLDGEIQERVIDLQGLKISPEMKEHAYRQAVYAVGKNFVSPRVKGFSETVLEHFSGDRRIECIRFYLQHPLLIESGFHLWQCDSTFFDTVSCEVDVKGMLIWILGDHQERSVKKALFERYMDEIHYHVSFDPVTPTILCRSIKDPNFLVHLLQKRNLHFENIANWPSREFIDSSLRFIKFLKVNYEEQRTVRILEQANTPSYLWADTLRMYEAERQTGSLAEHFVFPPARLSALHDALVCSAEQIDAQRLMKTFYYDEKMLQACETLMYGYSIRLPKNGRELAEWAVLLRNCLRSYAREVSAGETTIFGVFYGDKLEYAVEIKEGQMVQFYGLANTEPLLLAERTVTMWYERHFNQIVLNEEI